VSQSSFTPEQELESTNLLVILYRWRKTLIITMILAAVISAGASFMITPKFKSTATVFPARDNSIGEQIYESPARVVMQYGEEEDGEYLMQLLASADVRNVLIEKYDLWSVYGIPKGSPQAKGYMMKAYADAVNVEATKFGSIDVTVLDADPKRAAQMANDITAYADSLHVKMRKERAKEIVRVAKENLTIVTEEVKQITDSIHALRNMGVYSYEEQIDGLSRMYGKALADGQSERAAKIKQEMNAIAAYGGEFMHLKEKLELALIRQAHLIKRLHIFETEDFANLSAALRVDAAEESDKKAYPIRWLIVAISMIATLVFTIAFILIWDTFSKLKQAGKI
jgi:capsular polysaccharide biosynthesis protein